MKETGGPAFPAEIEQATRGNIKVSGMSLRDYFAGQALMGICAHEDTGGVHGMVYQDASKYAYGIADAMIKGRNK